MAEIRRGPFILLFALDRQLADLLAASMAQAPLRPGDFAVTSVVRLVEPVRPTELASLVGMRPTSLSNHLRRLADAGLVRRRRDPSDGRAALITLTAKGRRQTEACFPGFSAAIESFRRSLEALGVSEDRLLDDLERVSQALSEATARFETEAREVS